MRCDYLARIWVEVDGEAFAEYITFIADTPEKAQERAGELADLFYEDEYDLGRKVTVGFVQAITYGELNVLRKFNITF